MIISITPIKLEILDNLLPDLTAILALSLVSKKCRKEFPVLESVDKKDAIWNILFHRNFEISNIEKAVNFRAAPTDFPCYFNVSTSICQCIYLSRSHVITCSLYYLLQWIFPHKHNYWRNYAVIIPKSPAIHIRVYPFQKLLPVLRKALGEKVRDLPLPVITVSQY